MEVFWICEGRFERRTPEELPALLAREDGFVWVDAAECDEEATKVLAEVFRFHPLGQQTKTRIALEYFARRN